MDKKLVDVILVILGNILIAFGVAVFILPYNILSGGLAGLGIALQPLIHIDPLLFVNIFTIGLFLVGTALLGKNFAFKTLISSIVYPVALLWFKGRFMIDVDPLLASLYGGLLTGIGAGIAMRTGASTGGINVVTMILHKYTTCSLATLVLIIDAVTVGLGLFSMGIESVLIGFIAVWTASQAVDKVLMMGLQDAKAVQIISPRYQEISDAIHEKMVRGTTLLHAEGGYSHDVQKVVLTVVSKNQYRDLTRLVNDIDPNAFIVMSDTNEVKGLGFTSEFKI
ncbi:YitT family protein [Anaerorhabdus sp.]|uniref:YitT family protein n=1 Tax=Anaerorhabdus sp. TaxID=1872524 RepID=UPI002FC63B36